jgi:D-arabinose 1-dehydrogenase-like Zn-dependent alcohol dehydrogenase
MVPLRLTHLLAYPLDGSDARERDAVALAATSTSEGPPRRFFVPGRLPCGSCGLCRRGLAAACAAAVTAISDEVDAGGPTALELPERFLTPIDEPPAGQLITSEAAAGAGLVALAIQAAAAANLTAGDVALWLGGGVVAEVGAQLTAGRSARTLVLGEPGSTGATIESFSSPSDLRARLEAEPPAESAGHQRSTRRLFLTRIDAAILEAASQLAEAGASLVSIGRGPARLGPELILPPETRLARVSGYHPDLVPEALALLARAELKVPQARPLAGA